MELTQHSRDGGKDIILYCSETGEKAIVECKRYRNKISVEKVDRLIGVQLIEGIKKAFFVTSSDYTRPARQRQFSSSMNSFGFSIELKNGDDLLKLLGSFNELIPQKKRSLSGLAEHRAKPSNLIPKIY
ncbi:restriction endonuclease [bacterium]|nr:restriction endonuclease [bacterium]